jgi:hypothetical protein
MARRLLLPVTVLFLVLLVLGSLGPNEPTRTDTSTTATPPPDATPSRTVEATLPAQAEVRARVGDLVTLTVEAEDIGGVEVPAFGESEPVAPGSPALFDLLPTEPGRFVVRSAESGGQIGVLIVEEGPADEPEQPAEPAERPGDPA